MRKIFLLFILWAAVQEVYPQWALLSNDFWPNTSVTAFGSEVISGLTSFGSYDLAVSHDQGHTWSGNDLLTANGINCLFTADSVVFAGTPDGIYKSPVGTLNWSTFSEGLPSGSILKICGRDSLLMASGSSSLYMRITGDSSWTILFSSSPVGEINDFDFNGNSIVLAGYNGIAESHDLGLSWTVWPGYVFKWDAVTLVGDTIIAASAGGIYRKLISTGNLIKVSSGLIQLWNPYGYEYYGEFEMFHHIGDRIFLCGETGVYLLSANAWDWDHTGLDYWTYSLADNGETLFAAHGYQGIWGCDLDQLIVQSKEIPLVKYSVGIYPNPANCNVFIDTQFIYGRNAGLSVTDLQGRKLLQLQIKEPSTKLDVHAFPPGVYVVNISDDRNMLTGKFVKQ